MRACLHLSHVTRHINRVVYSEPCARLRGASHTIAGAMGNHHSVEIDDLFDKQFRENLTPDRLIILYYVST